MQQHTPRARQAMADPARAIVDQTSFPAQAFLVLLPLLVCALIILPR